MKRYITLVVLFAWAVSCLNLSAQDGQSKKDRIEKLKSQKVAFLTEKIDLTSAEAQEFWPIYNEFSDQMDEIHEKTKKNIIDLHKSMDSLSDAEKEAAIDRHVNYEVREAELEKEYHEKFKEVLSIDKLIKLYEAEHEFKKKMLRLIRGDKPSSCHEEEEKNEDGVV
jgi:tRNA U34 5-carboxymethylaminomethyl modifying GTPase MnmE/TrmE